MDLPFGQPYVSDPNTAPTDYTFTGQRRQSDIGLHHYGARWYNSYLNRWIQPDTIVPDPSNPQSLNRYSYANNNPLKFRDPTGHAACIDDLCDLVAHPETNRPMLRGTIPAAVAYIYDEMTRNAQGSIAADIATANVMAKAGGTNGLLYKAVALGIWASQVMDARVKDHVGSSLAPYLGNWDHKPILRDKDNSPVPEIATTRKWSTVGSSWYRFDTWSNLHYGYVGGASGFTEAELIQGAGVEQVGSDFASVKLPKQSPVTADFLASWDDPADTAAIQIGSQLWHQYALAVEPADLYAAVLENPFLVTAPIGGVQ